MFPLRSVINNRNIAEWPAGLLFPVRNSAASVCFSRLSARENVRCSSSAARAPKHTPARASTDAGNTPWARREERRGVCAGIHAGSSCTASRKYKGAREYEVASYPGSGDGLRAGGCAGDGAGGCAGGCLRHRCPVWWCGRLTPRGGTARALPVPCLTVTRNVVSTAKITAWGNSMGTEPCNYSAL